MSYGYGWTFEVDRYPIDAPLRVEFDSRPTSEFELAEKQAVCENCLGADASVNVFRSSRLCAICGHRTDSSRNLLTEHFGGVCDSRRVSIEPRRMSAGGSRGLSTDPSWSCR